MPGAFVRGRRHSGAASEQRRRPCHQAAAAAQTQAVTKRRRARGEEGAVKRRGRLLTDSRGGEEARTGRGGDQAAALRREARGPRRPRRPPEAAGSRPRPGAGLQRGRRAPVPDTAKAARLCRLCALGRGQAQTRRRSACCARPGAGRAERQHVCHQQFQLQLRQ